MASATEDIRWKGAGEAPLFGKRFLLTGKFPEYPSDGETELQTGKTRVAAIIRSFGGEVKTAISG